MQWCLNTSCWPTTDEPANITPIQNRPAGDEKFWQSYFGAVMTSLNLRKTAKNRNFSDFRQLRATLSWICFKSSRFSYILSVFSIWNNGKTSLKSLTLKLWSVWAQLNEGQKCVKLCNIAFHFFDYITLLSDLYVRKMID